ncbi:hypothetical protein H5410_006204 [Solanum commersonii]|uniref:Uncharacterized protein n=1 Tax=Solanum commersonii TaxID=4109 RepID=A0A9J6A9R0_SOLCO|nr:hypothetical protein H5410_006204 [Solanum commersonii]
MESDSPQQPSSSMSFPAILQQLEITTTVQRVWGVEPNKELIPLSKASQREEVETEQMRQSPTQPSMVAGSQSATFKQGDLVTATGESLLFGFLK